MPQYRRSSARVNPPHSWRYFPVCGLILVVLAGCAAFTNPVEDGLPVRRVPPEFLFESKTLFRQIPPYLLRRQPPETYRVAPGDILGIYIQDAVLGERGKPPPVQFSDRVQLTPSIGFPIPIGEDGAINLPQLSEPVRVNGQSLREIEKTIFEALTSGPEPPIKPDAAVPPRVLVSLYQQRTTRVLVLRGDFGGIQQGVGGFNRGTGILGSGGRNTGQVVNLPGYENDVLTALTRTGGLPDSDSVNEVIIQRGYYTGGVPVPDGFGGVAADCPPDGGTGGRVAVVPSTRGDVIRVPLSVRKGAPLPFTPEDVTLRENDILIVQAREAEVYYTGGLLFPRQFVLPRDYDLTVVEAIVISGGPLLNGLISQNNLAGNVGATGLGSPNPTSVTVIRKLADNKQVRIRVNLSLAVRDARENIIVGPGDVLILQETPGEALNRYVNSVLNFNFFSDIIRTSDGGFLNLTGSAP